MDGFANSLRSLNSSIFVNCLRRNCPFTVHNPPLSGHSNFPATLVIPKPTLLPVNRTPTVSSPSKYATTPSNNEGPAGIETGSNNFQSLIVCNKCRFFGCCCDRTLFFIVFVGVRNEIQCRQAAVHVSIA